jgi:hypothetical protein
VVPLDDNNMTGTISYVKRQEQQDGGDDCGCYYYVHTLNTPSGFRRKLRAMGIHVDDDRISWSDDEQKQHPDDPAS